MAAPAEDSDIIKMYEEMFSFRYTMDDPEYKATIDNQTPSPPCVLNYWCKRRNYDQNRGRRGGHSGDYSHRQYGQVRGSYGGHRGHHHVNDDYRHGREGYGGRRPDRYHPYNQGR